MLQSPIIMTMIYREGLMKRAEQTKTKRERKTYEEQSYIQYNPFYNGKGIPNRAQLARAVSGASLMRLQPMWGGVSGIGFERSEVMF